MTEPREDPGARWRSPEMQQRLRRRHAAERRFRRLGIGALAAAAVALVVLLISIAGNGWSAFIATEVRLDVVYAPQVLRVEEGLSGERFSAAATRADFGAVVRTSLRELFPEIRTFLSQVSCSLQILALRRETSSVRFDGTAEAAFQEHPAIRMP